MYFESWYLIVVKLVMMAGRECGWSVSGRRLEKNRNWNLLESIVKGDGYDGIGGTGSNRGC